jgi:hypothetical protein
LPLLDRPGDLVSGWQVPPISCSPCMQVRVAGSLWAIAKPCEAARIHAAIIGTVVAFIILSLSLAVSCRRMNGSIASGRLADDGLIRPECFAGWGAAGIGGLPIL